jgi:pimeloyl-ACP methyl ester carboxylesterase
MTAKVLPLAAALALLACAPMLQAAAREFRVRSTDGVEIQGEAAASSPRPQVAAIFVPGSGLFDRDMHMGASGTPRDKVFKDLADRMSARGVATVRYDVRGVRHGGSDDKSLIAGRTTDNMRDDLAAVHAWTQSAEGLSARCVVFFAHSEGMLHVARLAERRAPAPALIIGMGAAMESPWEVLRWQATERAAYSLAMMDANGDGIITNAEVRANFSRTPSGETGLVEPFLHPSGAWTARDLAELRVTLAEFLSSVMSETLAHPDADPYPSAEDPIASYQWRKHFFLDKRSAAARLAQWRVPIKLHYGERDSKLSVPNQATAASAHLRAEDLTIHVYPDRGHTLGLDVLLGPIEEDIANKIADEAAAVGRSCS